SNTVSPPVTPRYDCTQILPLTLEEAAFGCNKSIELTHRVRCDHCRGSGIIEHQNSIPCSICSGCGRIPRAGGRTGICSGCGGHGYLRQSACPHCAASGWGNDLRTLAVSVPPGMREGERLRLAGQAPLPPDVDMAEGDLYLEIKFVAHPLFVAEGKDLLCEVPVSVFRLLAGGAVEVPTLQGLAVVDLPPYSQPSLEFRLAGLGLPGKHEHDPAGNLVVHFECVYPNCPAGDELVQLSRLDQVLQDGCQQRAPSLAAWLGQLQVLRMANEDSQHSQASAESDQVG
ncbi:MAG TPA: DnaJ C-terminal domain-containing protein, partial [Accumulibacter sp.]|nr:DnaJ C-terminal domain-containing protein [Accumulibacter sp.]